jgi:carbon starvation protein
MRLSRYLIEEFWRVLWGDRVPGLLRLRFINSLIPVVLTAGLAFSRGYTRIWPLFGASNQLLAALTLVVATVWLVQKARTYWFAILPAVFMSGTTITALALTVLRRFQTHDYLLSFTAILLLGLALGFIVQSVRFFVTRGRGALTWGPASR